MIKLAANLTMMFKELPFLDRFEAAARAGFRGVECLFPYEAGPQELRRRLDDNGLAQVLFNAPAGNWAAGERGTAALPGREAECRAGVRQAIEYAAAIGCPAIHVMAGITGTRDAAQEAAYLGNLGFAASEAAAHGISITIEPLNSRVDNPGYFLDSTDQAARLIGLLGLPNIRLQYDVYHMQIMQGDLARSIERLLPLLGHIQVADNPGRHEPGTGEIAFPWLLGRIDSLGYDGWIGCEYLPLAGTPAGLGWAAPYLRHGR